MSEYIEREALRRVFEEQEKQAKELWKTVRDDYHAALVISYRDNIRLIDKMPVIHGKYLNAGGDWTFAMCNECGEHFAQFGKFYRFCPNCGAKMDEENNNV